MIKDFQNIVVYPVTIVDLFQNLCVALACGLIIALVYRYTYKGPAYSRSFVQSLVLLNLVTAVVILVIGNNLARAFGLVGAMSIIRFRTAVKDTQDIVFIFFALVSGMAAGVGLNHIAIAATLFISLVIVILLSSGFGGVNKRILLLQIAYHATPESEAELILARVMRQYCKNIQLINLKHTGYEQEMEAHYHIELKSRADSGDLLRILQELSHVHHAELFFDEDELENAYL